MEPTGRPDAADRGTGGRHRWLRTDRILTAFGIGVILYLVGDVLLALFAAVLVAVALDAMAMLLAGRTGLRRGTALFMVVVALLAVVVGGGWSILPQVADHLGGVWERLSELAEQARARLGDLPVMKRIFSDGALANAVPAPSEMVEHLASLSRDIVSAAVMAAIIAAMALFMVYDPALYRHGFLKLVPPRHRPLWDETLGTIGHALRWWLIGQMVSMTVLGVVTCSGLYFFGIDLWLGLGLMTAALTFVPFLGPAIAAVPILLISFSEGLQTGFGVTVFYLALQNLEGFFLTPVIQRQAVHLPPALLIGAQILMGALFGMAGLILAAPLTAAGMVAVNLLYVEGVLKDRRAHAVGGPKRTPGDGNGGDGRR